MESEEMKKRFFGRTERWDVSADATDGSLNFSVTGEASPIAGTGTITVISFQLIDGRIEVIKRSSGITYFLSDPPKKEPDRLLKEIYGVVDGKIALVETVYEEVVADHFEERK